MSSSPRGRLPVMMPRGEKLSHFYHWIMLSLSRWMKWDLTPFLTREVWPISFSSGSSPCDSAVSLTASQPTLQPAAERKLHYSHDIHWVMKVGHVELSRLLHRRTLKHPGCQQVAVNTHTPTERITPQDYRPPSLPRSGFLVPQIREAGRLLIERLLVWIPGT